MSDISEQPQEQQLFVRRSTGLVREASAIDAAIFNAVFSAPVGATLAWGSSLRSPCSQAATSSPRR
jgi:hypothetical protein